MRLPNSIATWCLILFFLLYGLQAFGLAIPAVLLALLALGVAIFTLIGRNIGLCRGSMRVRR